MGSEQFSTAVRGSSGEPISTAAVGAIETDNYAEGGTIAVGGSSGTSYPLTVNPAETIQELIITQVGDEVVADIDTNSGTTISGVPLNGRTLALDTIEIDAVTFRDPNATGALTEGVYIGE